MTHAKLSWWLISFLGVALLILTVPAGSAWALTGTPASASSPVASPVASPIASPAAAAVTDRQITFRSGADTLYGSLMMPAHATAALPAVVIISGSGPTDRNGNDPQFAHMNTNLNFARTLARLGVASLRYDKVGSGKTGLATHAGGKGVDFTLFVNEARAAYTFLAAQPGIDPGRILLLGHSEGGLIALVVAAHPESGVKPAGLILASPPGLRYLDLIQHQIDGQFDTAVRLGQFTTSQAATFEGRLATVIAEIRAGGAVTTKVGIPAVDALFKPVNIAFLHQVDTYDPEELAASLPASYPVLLLHGTKDAQVASSDLMRIVNGLKRAGNRDANLVEIQDADHTFRIVTGTPNPVADYANPDLRFAPEIEGALSAFLSSDGFLKPAA